MSGWETIGESAPASQGWQPGQPLPPDAPPGSIVKTSGDGITYMGAPDKAAPKTKDGWEDVAPAKAKPGPLDSFWSKLAAGGIEGMAKETLPVEIADRLKDVREANALFQKNREWDRERQRRIANNESTNGMEQWKLRRLNELVQETKPDSKPMSMKETWDSVKKAAVDDPGGFVGQLARGFIVHPELLATPEALPLRAAAFAGRAAKTATEAAQIGGAVAGESVLSQLNKTGTTSATQTAADTIMATIPLVAGRALTQRGKTSVAMATDLAVAKNLKDSGLETSPELVKAAVAQTEARVAQGQLVHEALRDSLESIHVSPEVAAEVAENLKPVEPVNPIEAAVVRFGGKEYEGATHIEAIKKAVADGVPLRADGKTPVLNQEAGDTINLFRTNEGKTITRDQAHELVGAKRTEDMRPMAKSEPSEPPPHSLEDAAMLKRTEGQTKAEGSDTSATPNVEDARKVIAEREGAEAADDAVREALVAGKVKNLESGTIDRTMMRVLGLTGIGAAAAALYTKDPKDAIWGALATGGTIAAGLLLRRSLTGLGQLADHLKDTRYRPTKYTDDWQSAVEGARLGNFRFTEQVKALVSKKEDREAITQSMQGTPKSKPLTPEQAQAEVAAKAFFEEWGKRGQAAGILPEDLLENYVTNLWTGLNKNDSMWRNLVQSLGKRNNNSPGMSPRSRFAMERVIPNYAEGIKMGLIPATMDIAEIMRIYGDNVSRAIANKNLVKALELAKHPTVFVGADGTKFQRALIIRDTPDALAKQIAQAAAIVDRQWDGNGELAKAFRDQAIKRAPKEYVVINHPQMRGYKVHEDIAPVMNNLFGATSSNAAMKLAYGLSIAAKRGLFSYSLFHVKSLADALLGTSMRGWVKVASGDAYRALRSGKQGDDVDLLVRNGLKVVERPMEGDVTPFTNALKLIETKHPVLGAPAKGARIIGQALDAFLWSVVHPTFKTATAMAAMEKYVAKGMGKQQAAKAAASFTNDVFGGLDWFRIADGVQNKIGRDLALAVTSPKGKQFMQIMMLAPDWTVATTRAMVKAIPGVSSREIAALHQGYVVRSLIVYAMMAEGLNQHFSGHHFWENEDPTMVDLGDGRKLQLSKHFMEPVHWLINPAQQALNKLGYLPKEAMEQALNKQFLSPKGAPPIEGSRVGHALQSMTPITGQQAFTQGSMPGLAGFFGLPVYGRTEEQKIEQARETAKSTGKDQEAAAHRAQLRAERAKRKREEATQ